MSINVTNHLYTFKAMENKNKGQQTDLSQLFKEFFKSEQAGGIVLLVCALLSLVLSNFVFHQGYTAIWQIKLAGWSIEHIINDGLMAIFFFLIGLELEREIYRGELSNIKNAMLPIFAALGGMLVPAGIHLALNFGTPTKAGFGIPMATDIAFAIGILSILGNRIPLSLKIFLTALAIIDDLGAILTIAIFYTKDLSFLNLAISLAIFGILVILNRLKVYIIWIYIVGGIAMWYFMHYSGVHATIAGVLLAFALPFADGSKKSPSYKVQHFLHYPVAFFILPVFALANTAIIIPSDWSASLFTPNSLGIFFGLFFGKSIGITLFAFLAVIFGFAVLPKEYNYKNVLGVAFLGGIGFTMSTFITLLAFADQNTVVSSKISILISSFIAGLTGFMILKLTLKKQKIYQES